MSIWHLVLIRADVDPDAVKQVAVDLESARSVGEMAFESVEVGLRLATKVCDGLMGGLLNTGSGGEHALLVRLADEAALKNYYTAPAHSVIRRSFLCRVSNASARLYDQADTDPDRLEMYFDQIERIAADIMTRIDIII